MTGKSKIDTTSEHPILGLKREDIKCYQDYSRNNIVICKPLKERSCNKRCAKYKDFSWEPKFISAKEFREGDFIATPLPSKIDNFTFIYYLQVQTEQKIKKPFKEIKKFEFSANLLRLLGY